MESWGRNIIKNKGNTGIRFKQERKKETIIERGQIWIDKYDLHKKKDKKKNTKTKIIIIIIIKQTIDGVTQE